MLKGKKLVVNLVVFLAAMVAVYIIASNVVAIGAERAEHGNSPRALTLWAINAAILVAWFCKRHLIAEAFSNMSRYLRGLRDQPAEVIDIRLAPYAASLVQAGVCLGKVVIIEDADATVSGKHDLSHGQRLSLSSF